MDESIVGVVEDCSVLEAAAAFQGRLIVSVRGWAFLRGGSPIERIRVCLADVDIGDAVYGIERPDVAAVHGDGARYAGFVATMSLPQTAQGQLHVVIESELGQAALAEMPLPSRPEPAVGRLFLDTAIFGDGSSVAITGSSVTLMRAPHVTLRGWAFDRYTKPMAILDASIDGKQYPATLGFIRDDVAGVFQSDDARFSGFFMRIPLDNSGVTELAFQGTASDGMATVFESTYRIIVAD